jgi:hypothetical protein
MDLAKLRFYGFIHRCGGTRLLRKVFSHQLEELAKSEELTFTTRHLFLRKRLPPWIHELVLQMLPKYKLSNYASFEAMDNLSKND